MFSLFTFVISMFFGVAIWAVPTPAMRERVSTHKLSAPLLLTAWETSNCKGNPGYTQFSDSVVARNISNYGIFRSFQLNRTLTGQEQLDISVTDDYATWYPDKDQLAYNSSSCTNFWQSYYAINGSTTCHKTPPFTCHRLWNNPGLPMT
ncbi:hypothetical protein N7455_008965 [Penicillium solitum]|uniref:uncharacterized protein n=1 Tax=Penicillium solitum TaxID=60172 RepID=UPI0032C41E85|nr:hypothetical protein N7455_008965 [Penicillium solitum]